MGKKTLILTTEQINKIIEGDISYFSNPSDYKENLDNEITVSSKTSFDGDGEPVTTDKIAQTLPPPTLSYGMTKQVISCSSKREWERNNLYEETHVGNNDLVGRKFNIGTNNNPEYVSYTYLTTLISDLEKKRKQMGNAFDKTSDFERLDRAKKVYSNAKSNSKSIRDSKKQMGMRVIKQHDKESGNGKAHSLKNKENGIITYEN